MIPNLCKAPFMFKLKVVSYLAAMVFIDKTVTSRNR